MHESFEVHVRKQHLMTSYFDLSSTEELKNYSVNYQHTSTSLTIDCAAVVNCRFQFVAAYMVDGKHMPDCGLTGNETNVNRHEKPNGLFLLNFL